MTVLPLAVAVSVVMVGADAEPMFKTPVAALIHLVPDKLVAAFTVTVPLLVVDAEDTVPEKVRVDPELIDGAVVPLMVNVPVFVTAPLVPLITDDAPDTVTPPVPAWVPLLA